MKKVVAFVTCLVFLNGCVFDCERYLKRDIMPLTIDGIVVSKFKSQTGCFGDIILRNDFNLDTLKDLCFCMPDSETLWKYVEDGDSLHKPAESLEVLVFRNGARKLFQFPCCNY